MESEDPNPEHRKYATDILTISVLAIIICAPTGATLMAVLGPKFLVKGKGDVSLHIIALCSINYDLARVESLFTNQQLHSCFTLYTNACVFLKFRVRFCLCIIV